MHVINVRNVHEALPEGLRLLETQGYERESRNGTVVLTPMPVTTMYRRPTERVMLWQDRDCNPFFHFMESLWMLAGRNDVELVERYVARMRTFSDNGKTLHGAYGHRWINHFGRDQLTHIINILRENPEDRRCVLQMWDATIDLARAGKDVPCNTQAYFSRGDDGDLDMTVCCRSNDMVWGAYGANAVHFSMLQEYMASAIGCKVGYYWQISNNYHAYKDTLQKVAHLSDQAEDPHRTVSNNPYELGMIRPFPIMSTPVGLWRQDLKMFLEEGPTIGLRDPFFRKVATPIMMAHQAYRDGEGARRYTIPLEIIQQCRASDWQLACTQWLQRRFDKFMEGVSHEESN